MEGIRQAHSFLMFSVPNVVHDALSTGQHKPNRKCSDMTYMMLPEYQREL